MGELNCICHRDAFVCAVIFAQKHTMSKIIINIVGGGFITILALIASNINFPFAVSLDKVIIGSILPLVPGVAFTNAIRDIANSVLFPERSE